MTWKEAEKDLETIIRLFAAAEKINRIGTYVPWYKRWWRQWRLKVYKRRMEKLLAR